MEYIIQIFTGGWHQKNYTAEAIIQRLESVITFLPVKSVIIGWNTDADLYRKVGSFLHGKGIRMLLWLPVFSETGDLFPDEPALDLLAEPVGSFALQEGESFAFCCPSSSVNLQNVFSVYETYFSSCSFDGVFLDKIRTQSFAAGVSGVLSCCCESCEKTYRRNGISLPVFRDTFIRKNDHLFDVKDYDSRTGIRFTDDEVNAFFRVKSRIISAGVNTICRYFKDKGMETGLDLYAPLMSFLVGQDYRTIAKEADFIKPMMYRKTEAPAGIGYEYELLRKSVPKAEGLPSLSFDETFLMEQLLSFNDLPCGKYPGIEVNYREDIARTDPEYIRSSLTACRKCGMDGAVLAWDIMLAPDSHLQAAGEIL